MAKQKTQATNLRVAQLLRISKSCRCLLYAALRIEPDKCVTFTVPGIALAADDGDDIRDQQQMSVKCVIDSTNKGQQSVQLEIKSLAVAKWALNKIDSPTDCLTG